MRTVAMIPPSKPIPAEYHNDNDYQVELTGKKIMLFYKNKSSARIIKESYLLYKMKEARLYEVCGATNVPY